MSRMKTILAFWLRLAVFAVILCILLNCTVYVLIPKHDYGICPITNFYRQPENTVDVLVLGTSCAYAGVNTNILFDEYGIAAYNLCTAEQPYWISYYYLEEALKTQRPKLILLDAKASIYQEDYSKRGRTILGTYGIRDFSTRMKAIAACVADEDFVGFALAFPELHSYYAELKAENFAYPPTNGGRGPDWKGYIEMAMTEEHEMPSLVWSDTRKPIHPRQQEYFEKLLALAQEHEIPVMLVGFPNPDYASDHIYYNYLWYVAGRHGTSGINYNNPDLQPPLSYASDFADWQHLNVKGSAIFTRRLGSDLKNMYDIPDRRGEETYATWQRCADDWFAKHPDHKSDMEEATQ